MKKSFSIMTDQQGFIFPYAMFIIAVVLLLVAASSNMYKNEIHIAKQMTDGLRINTLYQMGFTKFKEDVSGNNDIDSGKIIYEFPDGTTVIDYSKSDAQINLTMEITLQNRSDKKTIKRVLYLDE